jgi:aminomethyltransferase
MKRTPLYERHLALGGRMIDFGGWELPVQYQGIIKEHEQTRSAAGLFDVSHMGEIAVTGPDAQRFIQHMVTNDISGAQDMQAIYSPMCYESGGVVDDLLIYRLGSEEYLLIVNAANTDKDFEWLSTHVSGNMELRNVSNEYAQLAIQGPEAERILQRLCAQPLEDIRFYRFRTDVRVDGVPAIVSRTGYTGEDGFELYLPAAEAAGVWDKLLEAGKSSGLVPAGLGARDTLRFEVALPLYGHELSDSISPLEAGLGMFVKLDKEDFIGKEALAAQKAQGLKRRVIGFEMVDRGIPRGLMDVRKDGALVGYVTSGGFAPSVGKNLGLALVDIGCAAEGTELDIIIRDKPAKAQVVKKPFYSKKYKK